MGQMTLRGGVSSHVAATSRLPHIGAHEAGHLKIWLISYDSEGELSIRRVTMIT